MSRHVAGISTVLSLLAFSASAQAPARAVGVVRDTLGNPLREAEVSTQSGRVRTDSAGRFSLPLAKTDSTTITIRRVGYESVTFTAFTDSLARNDLHVEMDPLTLALPTVTVAERRDRVPSIDGFEERRRTKGGLGYFLAREQLRNREGEALSSILRQANGVRIYRQGNGRGALRFARAPVASPSRGATSCAPAMFLDGVRMRNLEVDDVPTVDVEAIELYANAGSAPAELTGSGDFRCGVVAIWTRRPILKSP